MVGRAEFAWAVEWMGFLGKVAPAAKSAVGAEGDASACRGIFLEKPASFWANAAAFLPRPAKAQMLGRLKKRCTVLGKRSACAILPAFLIGAVCALQSARKEFFLPP